MITEWPDEGLHYDSRKSFYESWMVESPERIQPLNGFRSLLDNLLSFMDSYPSIEIENDIYYLEGRSLIYFYHKIGNIITTIVELEKKPQSLWVVNMAKDEKYQGAPPYMTDIYKEILYLSNGRSLVFTSDKIMTNSGVKVWKKLLDSGYTVSVYDSSQPGQSLTRLSNAEELEKYIGNKDYQKYRFILSESNKWLAQVKETFTIRRTRELAGITADKDFR